jgi:hypothetical protein
MSTFVLDLLRDEVAKQQYGCQQPTGKIESVLISKLVKTVLDFLEGNIGMLLVPGRLPIFKVVEILESVLFAVGIAEEIPIWDVSYF